MDYVLKPVGLARLATTVSRVKAQLGRLPPDLSGLLAELARRRPGGQAFLRWINASVGLTVKVITVDDVCYFKAETKYTLVATAGGER